MKSYELSGVRGVVLQFATPCYSSESTAVKQGNFKSNFSSIDEKWLKPRQDSSRTGGQGWDEFWHFFHCFSSGGNCFLCSALLFAGNGKELLLHPVCLRNLAGWQGRISSWTEWPCPLGDWKWMLHPLTKGTRDVLWLSSPACVSSGWSSGKAHHAIAHCCFAKNGLIKSFLWTLMSLGCCRMKEYR